MAFSFGAAAVWAHVYFHKGKEILFLLVMTLTGREETYYGHLKVYLSSFAEDIKKHNKKKEVIALLVIAFILTFFGLGLGITSAVLVHSKSVTQAMNLKVH